MVFYSNGDRRPEMRITHGEGFTDWIIFNPPSTWKWSKIWLMIPLELLGKKLVMILTVSQKSELCCQKESKAKDPNLRQRSICIVTVVSITSQINVPDVYFLWDCNNPLFVTIKILNIGISNGIFDANIYLSF